MATKRNGIGHIKRSAPNRDYRRKHLQGALRVHCKSLTKETRRTETTAWMRACWKQIRAFAS